MSLWLDEELIDELRKVFGGETRGAMREALRLGIMTFEPEQAMVKGPFDLERPFATKKISKLRDEKAREAWKRLR